MSPVSQKANLFFLYFYPMIHILFSIQQYYWTSITEHALDTSRETITNRTGSLHSKSISNERKTQDTASASPLRNLLEHSVILPTLPREKQYSTSLLIQIEELYQEATGLTEGLYRQLSSNSFSDSLCNLRKRSSEFFRLY